MCQLHFIMNPGKPITTADITLLQAKLKKGASFNPHGWGVFGVLPTTADAGPKSGTVIVLKQPLPYTTASLDVFHGCSFVVGHNRLSTSGANDDQNTHPIDMEHIVIAHNGIIHGRGNEIRSDTYKIALALNANGGRRTASEEVKHIEKVFKKESGSYSIFIYFKRTGNLYYFKNETTQFTFKLLEKPNGSYSIVGATKCDNYHQIIDKSIYGFTLRKNTAKPIAQLTPQDNVIYTLSERGLEQVGEIKPSQKAAQYAFNYGDYWKESTKNVQAWNDEDNKKYLTKWDGGY